MRRLLHVLQVLLAASVGSAYAATCTTAVTGGNWGTATNWTCDAGGNHVPVAGDNVVVNRNFTVNAATASLGSVTVNAGATLTQSSSLTAASLTVAGTLNSTNTLNISGATSISGLLSINATTGTHTFGSVTVTGTLRETVAEPITFNGDVLISGGTFTENGAAAIGFAGNFTNNGTYTASTGSHTFSGANKTIGGTSAISMASMNVGGTLTYTGSATLTITTTLAGAGTLTNQGYLIIGDNSINPTLAASTSGNTVEWNAAVGQTVAASTYHHLVLSGSGAKNTSNVTTINGDLEIKDSATSTSNAAFTVAGTLRYSSSGATTLRASRNISVGRYEQTAGTLVDNGNTITVTGTGAGAWSKTGTFTATGTVVFTGAAPQIGASNFSSLTVNVGTGNTATLTGVATPSGNLTVSTGTFDLASFTADRTAAGGTITISDGATLKIGSTNGFPGNYSTRTLGATSAVEYAGSAQAVLALASPGYGHLTLSGSGVKTPSSSFTVRGNLVIGGTVTLAGGTTTQTVNGGITNNGTHTASSGRITLSGGTAAHALSGSGSYANLELSDTQGAALGASPTVTGVLTLTSGVFTTSSNTLITTADCPGSISRSAGWVAGNLRVRVPSGTTTCTMHVGDAASYRNVLLAFTSVTTGGDLTAAVSQAAGDHPNIGTSGLDSSKSVNRYWKFTNSGIVIGAGNYSATFNFVSGDLDAGTSPTSDFEIQRWDGSAWSSTTTGTRTSTSTQATGMTSFSDFAIASPQITGFLVELSGGGSIPTQEQLTPFNIRITAIGSNNQVVTSFTGTVTIDTGCGMPKGPFTSGNFVAGVRDPESITIANVSKGCTITATLGAVTGTSNSFPVGKDGATVSTFDGCEYATTRCDPATTNFNRLFTKLAGTAFNLDIVALDSTGAVAAVSGAVTVQLLAYSSVQTVVGADRCPTAAPTATIAGPAVTLASGRPSAAIAFTSTAFSSVSPNYAAYRDVRVKVTCGSGVCSPSGVTYCSADNFAVRPATFTLSSTGASQTGTSGTPRVTAGANFDISASTSTGYDGTPAIDTASLQGSTVLGTLAGTFPSALPNTGVSQNTAFTYSEVGTLTFQANAVRDTSFTSVDQAGGDCTLDYSATLVGGKYGCYVGSPAQGFGRFVPHQFALTSAGGAANACTGFSYLGQSMSFTNIKLEARNTAGNKTQNYAGAYAHLNPTSYSAFNVGARDIGTSTQFTAPRLSGTTSGTWTAGELTLTINASIARLGTGAADGAFGTTKIGIAPSDPEDSITLRSSDFDFDVDGAGGNDRARVGGADTIWRFGRLYLSNTYGSEKLNLSVPVEAQYYDGTSGMWRRNTLDGCTPIVASNVALGNYGGSLNAGNMGSSHVSVSPSPMTEGLTRITLSKPDGAARGSVGLALNLGTGATADICAAWAPSATATGANLAHLRGDWCTATAGYNEDPAIRVDFGITRSRFIFNRENY